MTSVEKSTERHGYDAAKCILNRHALSFGATLHENLLCDFARHRVDTFIHRTKNINIIFLCNSLNHALTATIINLKVDRPTGYWFLGPTQHKIGLTSVK